jgi:hypothetical protein
MPQFKAMDDRVVITEQNFDGKGSDRIVHVYTRQDEKNIMRLWCDIDGTFNCPHTECAWTSPAVQEMVQTHAFAESKRESNTNYED